MWLAWCTQLEVLKACIVEQAQAYISGNKSFDNILVSLIQLKYLASDHIKYNKRLENIKKKKHKFISEYRNEIGQTPQNPTYCKKKPPFEINTFVEDIFIHVWLEWQPQIWMIELNLTNMVNICESVSKIEKQIIEQSY